MRLKTLLLSACMLSAGLSSITNVEGAVAKIARWGMRAVAHGGHTVVRGAATAAVNAPWGVRWHSAVPTDYKPWQQLPMDVVVRDARYDETFKILLGEEGAEE